MPEMVPEKKPRKTNAEIAHALETSAGNIAATRQKLGMSRQAVEKRIKSEPWLGLVRLASRAEFLDGLEIQQINAAQGGDLDTGKWLLDRLGKDRGYSTRREITGRNEKPIEVDISKLSETKLDYLTGLANIKPDITGE